MGIILLIFLKLKLLYNYEVILKYLDFVFFFDVMCFLISYIFSYLMVFF